MRRWLHLLQTLDLKVSSSKTAPTNERPVFQLCKAATATEIAWNFKGLYLISKAGEVSVPGADIEADIKALLAE